MVKEITVGNLPLKLKSTAGTALFYKRTFRKELLKEVTEASIEDLGVIECVQKLAFIMAMQGENTPTQKMLELTEVDFLEWLDGFDSEDFQNVDIVFSVLGVWNKSIAASVNEKN